MTTGKTIALTRWTFVGKVMSLLLNVLSAATKSLQSCLTLCNPIDGLLPGSSVPGILQNLLQHHSSKASIFQRSAFFMVQLSHPYMTTGQIIAWAKWTFVGKVMFLLFNMLSCISRSYLVDLVFQVV